LIWRQANNYALKLHITNYKLKRQEVYMTKLRTGKKAHTLSGAAALIIAAFLTLLFTGCPNAHGNKPATPKYQVTFNVDGAGGTLKAKADGVAETETSPITVEHGKTVAFTAAPAAGYRIKEWKLDGNAVTLEVLQDALAALYAREPELALSLECERTVEFERIVQILTKIQGAGISRIGIVHEPLD